MHAEEIASSTFERARVLVERYGESLAKRRPWGAVELSLEIERMLGPIFDDLGGLIERSGAARSARSVARRAAEGRCVQCGDRLSEERAALGLKSPRCDLCQEKRRERRRGTQQPDAVYNARQMAKRAARAAKGCCVKCGDPLPEEKAKLGLKAPQCEGCCAKRRAWRRRKTGHVAGTG